MTPGCEGPAVHPTRRIIGYSPGCGGPAVHPTLRIIGYSPLQILEIWVKWSMYKLSKDISTLWRGGLFETRSHAASEAGLELTT